MGVRRPTTLLLGTALFGLVGLTACGDSDEPTEDASAVDGGDAVAADCEASPGETITVEIPEFAFSPDPVEISACDSVVWENTHSQAHTSTGKGDKAWSTDNIAAGSAAEPVLFDESGSFAYICALHPFMTGTVEVS